MNDKLPAARSYSLHSSRSECLLSLRRQYHTFDIKKPDPGLQRKLQAGFLLPYLLDFDALCYGRWEYWTALQTCPRLPALPIPEMDFYDTAHGATRKMIEKSLDCIPRHGQWQTMGSWEYVRYFFDWLLWGFGHAGQPEAPAEPHGCEGASMRLYQVFNLCAMQLHPYDYFADLLADSSYGRRQGFFPTPMPVCQMMAAMLMEGKDCRTETVCDPCCGTGRFPLVASNYSLRLYAQDIDGTLIKATLVNGYCYAPWLPKPIGWLDGANVDSARSGAVSERLTQAANTPAAADYLSNTEHDAAQQWQYEPIKKRRQKEDRSNEKDTIMQGLLF